MLFAPRPGVKNVIGVVSGKGGVGKSLVTGLLACAMNAKGLSTAILDADITGPSIPRMFGLHDHLLSDGHMIQPALTKNGIKVVSMNLCLPDGLYWAECSSSFGKKSTGDGLTSCLWTCLPELETCL